MMCSGISQCVPHAAHLLIGREFPAAGRHHRGGNGSTLLRHDRSRRLLVPDAGGAEDNTGDGVLAAGRLVERFSHGVIVAGWLEKTTKAGAGVLPLYEPDVFFEEGLEGGEFRRQTVGRRP